VVVLQHDLSSAWERLEGFVCSPYSFLCPCGYRCSEPAPYAEPTGNVIAQAGPERLDRSLHLSTAAELPQPTTLLDPCVRELGYLGALLINQIGFLGAHFVLEGCADSRFFAAGYRPSPIGFCLLGAAHRLRDR
jgi:hypothetical protein